MTSDDRRVIGTFAFASPYTFLVKRMFTFLLWCLLFILCWPIAVAALLAYPIIWVLLLPFRIFGIAAHGVLAIIHAIIFLPVRVLRAI